MTFPFELDPFQIAAIRALNEGRSVVVCAPTGSGKTVVGEHAIHREFRDFRLQFGPERVGLLTGDVSIGGDAPVVVMTTEVFRNMLYGVGPDSTGARLDAVAFAVLDECHYINDVGRGTVWAPARPRSSWSRSPRRSPTPRSWRVG
jgi:superfamily II RNA helicase